MKFYEKCYFRFQSFFKGIYGSRRYPLRIADISQKKDTCFVVLQCFHTNTFKKWELSKLVADNELLSQLSPRETKLLMEIWFQKLELEKNSIALNEEGFFIYSAGEECFYRFEDIDRVLEDSKLMKSLDAQSAFLLGRAIGERKLVSPRKNRLLLVK